MGCRPTLADLTELSPSLGRGLKQLLAYPGQDVEHVFCRNFVVEYEDPMAVDKSAAVAGVRSVELMPGGADIPVTHSTRGAFVDLYVQHVLDTLVSKQFAAFAAGFYQASTPSFFGLKRPRVCVDGGGSGCARRGRGGGAQHALFSSSR
jgi:hypothetical protein